MFSLLPLFSNSCIYPSLNQCTIWGRSLFPLLALYLIDQSTVLLLQQRPLGEYIASNPSQLETISSFPFDS